MFQTEQEIYFNSSWNNYDANDIIVYNYTSFHLTLQEIMETKHENNFKSSWNDYDGTEITLIIT